MIAALGLALPTDHAASQQKSLKEQLTGIWTLVSTVNTAPDGTKQLLLGDNPKGILILDASGHYAMINLRGDVPKFKSNNRLKGTPEENTAAVHGTVAHFGTWSVDDATGTFTQHIEHSMFPNQAGTQNKRSFTVAGDELRSSNPTPGAGGSNVQLWKRAK